MGWPLSAKLRLATAMCIISFMHPVFCHRHLCEIAACLDSWPFDFLCAHRYVTKISEGTPGSFGRRWFRARVMMYAFSRVYLPILIVNVQPHCLF